jgi:hypothetical protein
MFSNSLVANYYIIGKFVACQLSSVSWNYKQIEIYINAYLNITASYSLSVYNSQWTNSATHSGSLQQLATVNCVEPPSPTNCHPFRFFRSPPSFQKPSAVCRCGCFLREFSWVCWRCLRKKNLIFIELGKVNFILLTERQEECYKCSRWSEISSIAPLKQFIPYYLFAHLFLILTITVSTDHSRCPGTELNVLPYTQLHNDQPSVVTYSKLHFSCKLK